MEILIIRDIRLHESNYIVLKLGEREFITFVKWNFIRFKRISRIKVIKFINNNFQLGTFGRILPFDNRFYKTIQTIQVYVGEIKVTMKQVDVYKYGTSYIFKRGLISTYSEE